MPQPPPLDRVNSATLARLAAERGAVPEVTPLLEEMARKPGGQWKRWLPWLFLALSLFALGSLVWTLPAMAEDGWSTSDAVQLILMLILVGGVLSQGRSVLKTLRLWRSRTRQRTAESRPPRPFFDAVAASELALRSPVSLPRPRRRSAARRKLGAFGERVGVITVVVLAILGFAGMLFVLGWIIYSASIGDPGAWLTAPFTALTGFGAYQVVGSARRSAFRGRPLTLVSRAFRDSVRVWGSGSVATKVALTTTATASVAGAAVAPVLVQRDTPYDLFLQDSAAAIVYKVDLATDISERLQAENETGVTVVGLATTNEPIVAANGSRLPKGSLLFVLESANGWVQAVVGVAPGSTRPVRIAMIDPVIPGASFSGGSAALYALQPNGAAWRVDLPSGSASQVPDFTFEPGPFTFDADTGVIIMFSGGEVIVLNPQQGTVVSRSPLRLPEGDQVCGIAAGPGDFLFYTLVDDPEIYVYRTKSGRQSTLALSGDRPAAPCQLVAVPRR